MKIPTKLIGPTTSRIIENKRVKIWRTDVGDMTGEEIYKAIGLREWKIVERYYKYGVDCKNIFENTVKERTKFKQDLSDIPQGIYAHLGKRERKNKLKLLPQFPGTWEIENT